MRPCWRSYDADGTLPKTQPVQSRRSASFSRDSRRGGQKRREPAGHQSPRLHRAETQSVRHQSVINHRPVSQMSSVGPLPWVWSASKMRRSQSVMLSLEVRGFLREARPGGERRGLWLFSASFRKEQHLSLTSITSLSDLEVSRWSRSTLVTGQNRDQHHLKHCLPGRRGRSRVQAAPVTFQWTKETQRRLQKLPESPSLSACLLRPHTGRRSSWPAGSA